MLIPYSILAVVIWMFGFVHTGKYVRPRWKLIGKFVFYVAVSVILIMWLKHFSLIFIIGHPLLGLIFHIRVCGKHDINWLTCQPIEKYKALHEKWGRGKL